MLTRAASELQAANGALAHLGESRLTSLSENRPAARMIKDHFGAARDALLRRHDWNFATRWQTLAPDPAVTPGTFGLMYPLPADCIRVRSVEGLDEDAWTVEGNDGSVGGAAALTAFLCTDAAAPRICYTRLVDIPVQWDALFLECFELHLASRMASLLGRDDNLSEALEMRLERRIGSARRIDAREAARSAIGRNVSFISVRR